MDFCSIEMLKQKNGIFVFYPDFKIIRSKDLMVRGKSFYAIWDEKEGLWSTDIYTVSKIIDAELDKAAKKFIKENSHLISESDVVVKYIGKYGNNSWNSFNNYLKTLGDNYKPLDGRIVFQNEEVAKEDYISHKLDYSIEEGDTSAWDELVGTLYSSTEKEKIEYAIGSLVTGDSRTLQKFFAFYGDPGTGKSTVIDIIQKMFDGYWETIDAKALTSDNDAFSLSALKSNPLILVQHDADLSKITDNSRLNSLVSHETLLVNEKFKAPYSLKPRALIIVGTNFPIKITDGKSGLIRRLVDIIPTGEKFPKRKYDELIKKCRYELGAIAFKCRELYLELGKSYYSNYKPTDMMYKTDPFYNFVDYYRDVFESANSTTITQAYEMYKTYVDLAGVNPKQIKSRTDVRENLKDYFKVYQPDTVDENGIRVRHYYSGFKSEKFEQVMLKKEKDESENIWLEFNCTESRFDKELCDAPAQYATEEGNPKYKWVNCVTTLKQINTHRLHWVRVPLNHIVIDFDLKDGDSKSFAKNLEAASQWPPTYAELSKSGQGIHLHYIYKGDPTTLSRIYADNVEIKVFTGNGSLRRKLSKCNDIPIAVISSGLPLKEGGKKVVDTNTITDEKKLRSLIKGNLQKKYLPATKPSMDFINKLCSDAYTSGMHYDISDMSGAILAFAANSTNNSEYCIDIFNKLKLKSDEPSENKDFEIDKIVFFDVEDFPNLFLVNWKFQGKDEPVHRMINPTPEEIEFLIKHKLVGFNCRRYDNHMLYGRLLGETNFQLFQRSQMIIGGDNKGFSSEAYNLSYTDIYDFSSKKQSLKKFEIELGIHHQELGLKWDEPVPEELWPKVAEYCDNDVISTEAVWDDRQADFVARQILADICGLTVNDTTNTLTTKIIFGNNKNPQSQFNYRFMGQETAERNYDILSPDIMKDLAYPEYTKFLDGKPVFPGYTYEKGMSSYRGEEFGEGGYVYAEHGIYWDALTEDVASMHPSSVIAEELFGPVYTKRFAELVQARIYIKHGEFDKCANLLEGKLTKYLTDPKMAKALSGALKIAINSVYGLTFAKFTNAFKDDRNVDNIVAKRGELFMINLKHEVQAKGYKVIHIKTDSIKIEKPDDYICDFIVRYGKLYGYNFEVEHHFDRIALVNDAVYIAKCADDDPETPGQWTATGTQFAVPYVFKSLFSKEEITIDDLCETKSCNTSLYLDFNEQLPEGEHNLIFVGKVGQFCPILDGFNGGVLLREQEDKKTKEIKYNAVTGTKGYRWKEAEIVKANNYDDQINRDYYRKLCDDAIKTINSFDSFEEFIA